MFQNWENSPVGLSFGLYNGDLWANSLTTRFTQCRYRPTPSSSTLFDSSRSSSVYRPVWKLRTFDHAPQLPERPIHPILAATSDMHLRKPKKLELQALLCAAFFPSLLVLYNMQECYVRETSFLVRSSLHSSKQSWTWRKNIAWVLLLLPFRPSFLFSLPISSLTLPFLVSSLPLIQVGSGAFPGSWRFRFTLSIKNRLQLLHHWRLKRTVGGDEANSHVKMKTDKKKTSIILSVFCLGQWGTFTSTTWNTRPCTSKQNRGQKLTLHMVL